MLVLYLIRSQVLDIPYSVMFSSLRAMYIILLASYYDFLLALSLGAVCMALSYLLRKYPRAQPFLLGFFIGCVLLSVGFGLSYVTSSKLLGGPVTYAWLYYSDFLQNSDSKAALLTNISWAWAGEILGWIGLLLATSYLFYALSRRLYARVRFYQLSLFILALSLLSYFLLAPTRSARNNLTYKIIANPVLAFSHSVYASQATSPDLFRMQVPNNFEAFPTPLPASSSKAPSHPDIRNVVLFVMESVPAEYTAGYEERYNAMPQLARYLPQSLRVTDMYAQMPSTNNAAVSLLGSLYPMISYQSITKEHPTIRTPSLSSELKKHNFRTGFFFAADTRFQNMNGFLAHRQFDTVADFQTIACAKLDLEVIEDEPEFLSSVDESCLVQACTQWLPADSTGAPFFATIWTAQTHYPYFPKGVEKDFGVTERYLNRYLNALSYSDKQLGMLLDELKRRGLAESTLVVVVGDHGEAFGRHVQFGHASNIYEENVRIPLLLINPLLFHGETLKAIGGQVDVAPSILDVLRLPIPTEWQGSSLFNPKRLNRAYFFSPYSDYVFGYRTAQHKVIFNATTSETMVFDLKKDPQETINLADQMPAFVQESHQRLARWINYQDAYLKRTLKPQLPTQPVARQ
jgi:phosphoglycerol transferase MdoB-like AlkP superfamily enzyme